MIQPPNELDTLRYALQVLRGFRYATVRNWGGCNYQSSPHAPFGGKHHYNLPQETGSSLNARGNESHNDLILGDCSQLFHIPAFTIAKVVICFYSTSHFAKSYQLSILWKESHAILRPINGGGWGFVLTRKCEYESENKRE